jgi:hypothetical protein
MKDEAGGMTQDGAMIQDRMSQGWEGWLAPAVRQTSVCRVLNILNGRQAEAYRTTKGKPPFLTLRFSQSFSIFAGLSLSISLLSLLNTSLVLLVSLAGLGCATNQGSRSVPPQVESTISTLSDEIAAERYEKIYNEASELWRQKSSLEESTATFKTLRAKLGPAESRTLQSATEQQNSGGPLKGRAYIVNYRTKFQNGEGMETFTLVERDGRWLLARYFVNSTALK